MIDDGFVNEQKELIKREIDRLEREVAKARKYVDLGDSDEDNTQEFEMLEERQALAQKAISELGNLKKTLELIGQGKYGICQKCGGAIEKGRLKTYPGAAYCASHAQKN